MSKAFVQTTLQDEPVITESTKEQLGKLLGQYPFRNIKLIVRQSTHGNYIRPQLRFVSSNKAVVKEVKEKLGLSPKIDSYKMSWRITVTKKLVVQEILRLLLNHMKPEAQERARLVIEAIGISSTTLDRRIQFLPLRLSEIVGLLTV